jgi:hypothetical protein
LQKKRLMDTKESKKQIDKPKKEAVNNSKEGKKKEVISGIYQILILFILSEIFVFVVILIYGHGVNNLQKITNAWEYLLIPVAVCLILGAMYIGRKKLKALRWLNDKIFGKD